MYRPKRVRPRTKLQAARTTNTRTTTHGTPRIGRMSPRFALQSRTIATPPARAARLLTGGKWGGCARGEGGGRRGEPSGAPPGVAPPRHHAEDPDDDEHHHPPGHRGEGAG